MHEELGNNALLADRLGLDVEERFGEHEGVEEIGVWATADLPRAERSAVGCGAEPLVAAGGPPHVRRVGIVTGGGGSLIRQAYEKGLDTLVTGEGAHYT